MNYKIKTLPEFDKNIKRLHKKYKNIKSDIILLIKELQNNNKLGTHIVNNCYKIRLANSSIPTGKSGGFRIITYYIDNKNYIYLMSIYSKSDLETITEYKIKRLLKEIK
jgi:mRNA-degrading endonuclease RelE of RelBE toxin-antitoxin system